MYLLLRFPMTVLSPIKASGLSGFLPEQNLERIIETARLEGKERFAALIPETPYGQRIAAALEPTVTRYGGELVQVEYYQEEAQSYVRSGAKACPI
jgi:outer membrane PBP1 activator LpoA protein